MHVKDSPEKNLGASLKSGCEERFGLLAECSAAVRGLIELRQQQFQAIFQGDTEHSRFEVLIHMANEKKQLAKYAYLRHVGPHGCSIDGVPEETRS